MNITTPAVHAKSIDASSAAAPDHELLRFILRYAVRAPSGHNTQPWRFRIVGDCLELHADRTRALPVVDSADRALHISCGAALRHVVVALRHFGFACVAAVLPDRCDPPDTVLGDTPQDWMAAGQAVGTVPLRATAAGLAGSFLNQPIEAPALRAPLARLVALEAGQPQLLLRIGYPTSSTRPTPRRLVADVLIDTPPRPDGAGPASGAS